MRIQETMRKPMMEAKYLNVDNTDRYRPIIRLFYLKYEKLKYWLYQEEVFEELKEDPYFREYTQEQCQQDLAALTGWGNLVAIQDTRKVSTIEEFKNKKFRYQLSEASVEIERMVIRVENLFIESSSLEPTLLERIRINLGKIPQMKEKEPEAVYTWWNDLNNDFIRLNQNYQDYMRELNSVKAEEMMKTREFLVFKDRLIEYLRSFVKSLQINVSAIEQYLKNTEEQDIRRILEKVTEYELSIPRIDMEVDEEPIYDKAEGRWESLGEWFAGREGQEPEASKVFDTTNEIIRKITRYAARITELSNSGSNRREEYHKLAVMFSRCKDIYEAHRLAAAVFGMEQPLHLRGLAAIQRLEEERRLLSLASSRFAGLSWEEILEGYLGGPLQARKELKEQEEQRRENFFQEMLEKSLTDPAGDWLEQTLKDHGRGYGLLLRRYRESPQDLEELLKNFSRAVRELPVFSENLRGSLKAGKTELLPVFAARAAKDPHYFDRGPAGTVELSGGLV